MSGKKHETLTYKIVKPEKYIGKFEQGRPVYWFKMTRGFLDELGKKGLTPHESILFIRLLLEWFCNGEEWTTLSTSWVMNGHKIGRKWVGKFYNSLESKNLILASKEYREERREKRDKSPLRDNEVEKVPFSNIRDNESVNGLNSPKVEIDGKAPLFSLGHYDLNSTVNKSVNRTKSVHFSEQQIIEIYKKYPKRLGTTGRAEGIRKILKQLKTEDDLKNFEKAVTNYFWACKKQGDGSPSQYTKQFATFCSPDCWTEWIDRDEFVELPPIICG